MVGRRATPSTPLATDTRICYEREGGDGSGVRRESEKKNSVVLFFFFPSFFTGCRFSYSCKGGEGRVGSILQGQRRAAEITIIKEAAVLLLLHICRDV